MKIYLALSCCTALLGVLPAYCHHVDGYSMWFHCSFYENVSLRKYGPSVRITKIIQHGYLMQFYMEEDSDATPPLSRCLPETPIREKSHIDRIIGKFLYRIVLSGDCYSYDVMKHYNPEVKVSAKYTYDHTIAGCWKISTKLMENLQDNRKLTYWEDDQMTLDPDKFLELAPKGTYSFTQHGDYIRINYDLDASKIGGQGSDFKPEDDLRISNIKAGEAEYSEQKVHIRLADYVTKLPAKPYEMFIEWLQTKYIINHRYGTLEERGDASSANQFLITIPGNPPEDVYPFVDWDDASLQIVLSDSEHWVLNHRYLKVFNINISTHGDTKTYNITHRNRLANFKAGNISIDG